LLLANGDTSRKACALWLGLRLPEGGVAVSDKGAIGGQSMPSANVTYSGPGGPATARGLARVL